MWRKGVAFVDCQAESLPCTNEWAREGEYPGFDGDAELLLQTPEETVSCRECQDEDTSVKNLMTTRSGLANNRQQAAKTRWARSS
ncbi:unnamed protein product [Calypogeia fissa]